MASHSYKPEFKGNPQHLVKLQESLEKKDIWIWNDFIKAARERNEPIDLRGLYLENVALISADLSGANLSFASFSDVNFTNALFEKTVFNGASLYTSKFWNANFKNAVLSWSKLCASTFLNADFSGANFRKADLREVNMGSATLRGAIFEEVVFMDHIILDKADCEGLSFEGAGMMYANLNSANLKNANLRYVQLNGSSMLDTNLSGADLTGAWLHNINKHGWIIKGITCGKAAWGDIYDYFDYYAPGEFEQFFGDRKITLFFPGGMNGYHYYSIPALISHIQEKIGDKCTLQFKSLGQEGGKTSFEVILGEVKDEINLEKIKNEVKCNFEEELQKFEKKVAHLSSEKERLQVALAFAQETIVKGMGDTFIIQNITNSANVNADIGGEGIQQDLNNGS